MHFAENFDQLFDNIVEREPVACRADAEFPRKQDRPSEGELDERVGAAVALFHRGEYVRCLALLRELPEDLPHDPRLAAFRGASRAIVMGEVRHGLHACVQSIQRAFYVPDLYCALGVVLLRGGQRAKAYAAFQRGLRIDPRHPALRARIEEMGVRRRPVLPFLSRRNAANRTLGALRARLFPA